jgi:PKD repeat protein
LTYAWDLEGDGQFDDSTAVAPTFTYSTAGSYPVTLRVADGNGGTDTDQITVSVSPGGGGSGAGGLNLPGTAGTFVSTPSSAGLAVAGDLDVRVDVALDDWSTRSAKFITKLTSSGYELMLNTNTRGLRLAWADASGPLRIRNSTVALPVANGQRLQVRAVLDVDNGAGGHTVTFYYRTDTSLALTDGSGWTTLGSPVTTTGTTAIKTGGSPVVLGSHIDGTREFWIGDYHQAVVIGSGQVRAFLDFRSTGQLTSVPPDYSRWTDAQGNQWTVQGSGWTYQAN